MKKIMAIIFAAVLCLSLGVTAMADEHPNCTTADCGHEAAIGTTHYDTLEEAIVAAGSEETIINLINDVELDATIRLENKNITIDGAKPDGEKYTVSGKGIVTSNIQGFVIVGGKVTLKNMVLTDFDENLSASVGSVIRLDSQNPTFVAENLTIKDFIRDGFTIKSGNFLVDNCNINCASNPEKKNTLTKGFQIGLGEDKVTGTIKDIVITNSNSNYEDWETSSIEIYSNVEVEIIGGEISNTKSGIGIDNYWSGIDGRPYGNSTVTITGTTIKADTWAVYIMSREDQKNEYNLNIEDGVFEGYIAVYNGTENDEIEISGGTFSYDPTYYLAPDAPLAVLDYGDGEAPSGFAVGEKSIEELSETAAEEGATLTILEAGNGEIKVAPGVTVKNESGKDIKVNNVTVEPDEEVVARKEPKPRPEPCDHEFDENNVCKECGVKVTQYVDGKPVETEPEQETNPNTGAESAVSLAAAVAVVALAGAVISRKK